MSQSVKQVTVTSGSPATRNVEDPPAPDPTSRGRALNFLASIPKYTQLTADLDASPTEPVGNDMPSGPPPTRPRSGMNVNWEPEDDFEAMIAAAEGFDDQWPPSPTQSIPDFTRPTPDHPDPSHAEPMGNDMLPGSPLTRP